MVHIVPAIWFPALETKVQRSSLLKGRMKGCCLECKGNWKNRSERLTEKPLFMPIGDSIKLESTKALGQARRTIDYKNRVYSFLTAVIAIDYKFGGLKQHRFIIYSSIKLKIGHRSH